MTFNITLWLIVALLTAVIALFFCVWYIRKVLARLLFVGENLKDLVDLLTTYREHLKGIYQLEQYYGDQDLKNLIVLYPPHDLHLTSLYIIGIFSMKWVLKMKTSLLASTNPMATPQIPIKFCCSHAIKKSLILLRICFLSVISHACNI